jgi:hypothetical protein
MGALGDANGLPYSLWIGFGFRNGDHQALVGEPDILIAERASSLRRKAPANPTSSKARSRRARESSGASANIFRGSSGDSGSLPCCAVPFTRRMSERVVLIASFE